MGANRTPEEVKRGFAIYFQSQKVGILRPRRHVNGDTKSPHLKINYFLLALRIKLFNCLDSLILSFVGVGQATTSDE